MDKCETRYLLYQERDARDAFRYQIHPGFNMISIDFMIFDDLIYLMGISCSGATRLP